MSIIYDALKKIEKAVSLDSKLDSKVLRGSDSQAQPPKIKPRLFLIYALVVCFGLFIGNSIFTFLTRSKGPFISKEPAILEDSSIRNAKPIPKESNLATPQEETRGIIHPKPLGVSSSEAKPATSNDIKEKPRVPLVLNGVFFSGDEGFALINNHIVREGEVVDGATVKRIKLNEVQLDLDGSTVRLSTNVR